MDFKIIGTCKVRPILVHLKNNKNTGNKMGYVNKKKVNNDLNCTLSCFSQKNYQQLGVF
jgi:hypothetical protein